MKRALFLVIKGRSFFALFIAGALVIARSGVAAEDAPKPQYQFEGIAVPAARADEPKRSSVSATLADEYLRQGALAWKGSMECVSCHTTGLYLTTLPGLTPFLGKPLPEMRE